MKLFLAQPFPYLNTPSHKWIYILSSALFVFVFLLLFQPYGISEEVSSPLNSNPKIFVFFFSISLSTFLGLSLSQWILWPLFFKRGMTNRDCIFWLLLEAFLITVFMFLFSLLIPDLGDDVENELNLLFQLRNYFRCLVILLFPFFGSVVFFLVEKMNFEIKELSGQIAHYVQHFTPEQKAAKIYWMDENGQPDFSTELHLVLFLESSNQYVLIHYLDNDRVKKHIIRNRMKALLEQCENLPIQRCHRSFAINLLHVTHLFRKGEKEFLALDTTPIMDIPISKSHLKEIKKELESIEAV